MAESKASDDEPYPVEELDGHPAVRGFAAGLVVGALLGAGVALLFAPDRGARTRSNLSLRLRRLREEAGEELERAGGRTRRGLHRHRRQLQARLERAAERARDRLS